ncbi:helix-turn-helix domain-containing protein [Kitasatospora cineracea]|uniref:helix-turn-helix domain-containing protein n=1 Tax=Kitasatospora cineracea TaxID=88074 RepID=UPI003797F70C
MGDELGTLLNRLRKQSGRTQEDLAHRSGVSVRTIRRLERGELTDHRLRTVNLLADALELGSADRNRLAAALAGPESAPPPESAPLPGPARARVRNELSLVADQLAREVARRWRREEAQRRVHDPFPLPVRWVPSALADRPENVALLGPGAEPSGVDLAGDLRGVAEVYRRIPSGRLVVLGRAGSGKSVLAVRFVLDLLDAPSPPERVPVIFSLGSWDPAAVALRDWLVDRLLRDHPHLARKGGHGRTLAADLVDDGLVLPVLDGFDEIAEGLREEALETLNESPLPLVLTSRRAEYADAVRAARAPLVLAAAVELTDLSPEDLGAYLPRTVRTASGDRASPAGWDPVLAELCAGATVEARNLAAALSTPLMVILARTVYSDNPELDPAELLDAARFPDPHSVEEHLLKGFVPAVYRRRVLELSDARPRGRWDLGPSAAQRWLGHLAHHLAVSDRQDLAWWQIGNSVRRSTRILLAVMASGLCVAATDLLLCLLTPGMGLSQTLLQAVLTGSAAGLAFGLVHGILLVFGGGSFEPARVRLRIRLRAGTAGRPVRVFAARFAVVMLGGFVTGAGGAIVLGLESLWYWSGPITLREVLVNALVLGLVFGSAGGLVFGLVAVLESPLDVAFSATPLSLLAANRTTARRQVLVVAPALTLTIAFGGRMAADSLQWLFGPLQWPMKDGLAIGVLGGLGGALAYAFSFTAWGCWIVLARFWLPLTGRLPWRLPDFLDDAYRRGVLRQTGAVHQFRHLRLQHHLAAVHRSENPGFAPAELSGR